MPKLLSEERIADIRRRNKNRPIPHIDFENAIIDRRLLLDHIDALTALLAEREAKARKMRAAALWYAENIPNTPVPDWVCEIINNHDTISARPEDYEEQPHAD